MVKYVDLEKLFKLSGNDTIYKALRDQCEYAEERIFIQNLYKRVHYFLDSNLASELRQQFHPRFWEMYLADTILSSGKEIEKGRNKGPDISIRASHDLPRVWVEAVAPTSGDSSNEDSVKENSPTEFGLHRINCGIFPENHIQLRITSVFDKKVKKYREYKNSQIVDNNDSFIVAINTALIPASKFDDEDLPLIAKTLLPFREPFITVCRDTLETINLGYLRNEYIPRTNGELIPTTAFLNSEYASVSAVIYSTIDIFDCLTEFNENLLLIHNPLAMNPLPLGFLERGFEYWIDSSNSLLKKNWNLV